MKKNPLETLIELCGTKARMAAAFKIKPQAVQQWDCIPESRALEAVSLSKGKINARAVLEYADSLRRRAK